MLCSAERCLSARDIFAARSSNVLAQVRELTQHRGIAPAKTYAASDAAYLHSGEIIAIEANSLKLIKAA